MLPTSNPNRAPGRRRALDEAKRREVCALISAGCGMEGAARYVGCAPSTIRREAIRNAEFNDQLRRAGLTAELMPLNALRNAANKHWRAAAWLLERTNAQRFAKQNVRVLKPEQVKEYSALIADIFAEETKDPKVRRRILRRLDKLIADTERENLAAEFDPFPKPRRKPKREPIRPPIPAWKSE